MSNVVLNIEGGVATLSINRPEALNALSRTIVDEIGALTDQIACDKDVKAVILYSESNFAAGADIKDMVELSPEGAKAFAFSPVFNKIRKLSVPTIAAIEGYALGGGLELALTCDMRIAASGAKLGFPEITLGIMPGAGGTVAAARLIGEAKAKEMIFTGRAIGASDAEKIGLVNQVTDDGAAYDEAKKIAARIARMAPIAIKTAKESINQGLTAATLFDGIDKEAELWAQLFATEDQSEGMRAFIEKRKPVFTGK